MNSGIASWEGGVLALQTSELRDQEIVTGRKDKGAVIALGLAWWELMLGTWGKEN
jgi:hypothetical protein